MERSWSMTSMCCGCFYCTLYVSMTTDGSYQLWACTGKSLCLSPIFQGLCHSQQPEICTGSDHVIDKESMAATCTLASWALTLHLERTLCAIQRPVLRDLQTVQTWIHSTWILDFMIPRSIIIRFTCGGIVVQIWIINSLPPVKTVKEAETMYCIKSPT